MGKKRRSAFSRTGATGASTSGPDINAKDAKLAKVTTWEDIADEEDTFHLQRDQVALDRGRHDEEDDDEEEVMGLGEYGYEQSDEDKEDEHEEDVDVDEEGGAGNAQSNDDSEVEEEDEEAEEGWGSSKKVYYNDAEEDVDAAEEEAEALRIQSKQLAALHVTDFALADDDWTAPAATSARSTTVITEILPTKLPDTPEERLKLLHARHPEFVPLSEEFLALQNLFPALEMSAMAAEAVGDTEKTSAVVRKWKVASAYLGVLSMYFAILTEAGKEDNGAIDSVREHPIMSTLLGVRQAWEKVKGERVERIETRLDDAVIEANGFERRRKRKMTESEDEGSNDGSEDKEGAVQVVKKARATKEDFTDLDTLTAFPSKTTRTKRTVKRANADEDFGEETVLNVIDAEEKAKRKKSLRFFTSQINAKSTKRDAASRGAGGDMDVPHRERRKERELRLRAEAQRRRDKGEGADLSDNEPEPPRQSKKPAAPADDPDNEYYDLLVSTSKARKEEKKQLYEAGKAARREGNIAQMVVGAVGPDGKREIGWKIMKNKGLQPKRKKEVRNPRVKKKLQYEKRMKKVSSVKAVYKGGLRGAYGGEATGIKKNIVKSTKFA